MKWMPIETVPKDGTSILVMSANDDAAYVASWGEYPGNPVVDGSGADSWMYGWIFKNPYLHAGGHEEGFLGWDDDPMPTHWMPLPELPKEGE